MKNLLSCSVFHIIVQYTYGCLKDVSDNHRRDACEYYEAKRLQFLKLKTILTEERIVEI